MRGILQTFNQAVLNTDKVPFLLDSILISLPYGIIINQLVNYGQPLEKV